MEISTFASFVRNSVTGVVKSNTNLHSQYIREIKEYKENPSELQMNLNCDSHEQ